MKSLLLLPLLCLCITACSAKTEKSAGSAQVSTAVPAKNKAGTIQAIRLLLE